MWTRRTCGTRVSIPYGKGKVFLNSIKGLDGNNVSIPYGKGKGKFENAHEIISNKVSITYGKGKEEMIMYSKQTR